MARNPSRVRDDVLPALAAIGVVRPSELILRQLKELVSNGTLRPGDRLPAERELAAQFGVGRSHVRDALRRLEFYGVLRTHPQSGTVVAERGVEALSGVIRDVLEFDGEDIAALLETRVILEAQTARLAAMRASAEERRQIARAHDLFRTKAAAGDPALHEDLAFHLAIAGAARNTVLASLVHLVAPDIMRHHGENKTCNKPRLLEVVKEHQAICDAIVAREPDKAEIAMTEHARMAREQYRQTSKARVAPVSATDSPRLGTRR
jgi:GntR family transcriptional repressor for pyruvate dehydrogenase complex